MINKFHKTYGIIVWRGNNSQVELWYSAPSSTIPTHFHENIESKIYHIFGSCCFTRGTEVLSLPLFSKLKHFIVHRCESHGVCRIGRTGLLFLNVERLYDNEKRSAAKDLILCP